MENMLLSNAGNRGLTVNRCAVPRALASPTGNSSPRAWEVCFLNSRRELGFEGCKVKVSSRLGFVGGWRGGLSRRNVAPASGEESASTDLQVEGKVAEGMKDSNGMSEATTRKGERNDLEKSDTDPFDSLKNSIEELQREVEKAEESLAEISKEAINISVAKENNSTQEPKKGAKLHDFCLGIPYGGLLLGGGLVGFLISGSKVSILYGLLLGGAVLGLSVTSLKVWRQGKSCTPFILGQAGLSFILLARQLQEFFLTKKIFPTGFIAVMSALMLSFYTYVYAAGGNPPSKKMKASTVSQDS
uniref:Protein FATTY ACID EXPORT 1, chloroplastic n=1 Tax=Araucaria cunninghamii TaxID=56994 RepID=A0A0D6R344_ARACU